MNEKLINEIANKCWNNRLDGKYFDREKFAELIVRECAGVGYDASYYECALNVSNKILEHFGIE